MSVSKLEIAMEINSGLASGWKVSKDRNMKHRTVLHYAERTKRGLALYKLGGRPRLLDEQAMSEIEDWCQQYPFVKKKQIKGIIREKYLETWYLLAFDDDSIPKISPTSLETYSCRIYSDFIVNSTW